MIKWLGRRTTVGDLVALAKANSLDPHAVLSEMYEWKQQNAVGAAKSIVAAGFALALTPLVPIIQVSEGTRLEWFWLTATWIVAALFIAAGLLAFIRVRRVQAEFVAAHSLLSELVELKDFLQSYSALKDSK